jgi:hypothetical protein
VGRTTFITVGNPARRSLAELANAGHCPTTMSNAPNLATIFIQKGLTMNFGPKRTFMPHPT